MRALILSKSRDKAAFRNISVFSNNNIIAHINVQKVTEPNIFRRLASGANSQTTNLFRLPTTCRKTVIRK
jgi:hypothetical protein